MADIHEIGLPEGQTRLDLPPDQVLSAAASMGLKEVTIIGRDHNDEFYLASSIGDCYRTYYWLGHAQHLLANLVKEE